MILTLQIALGIWLGGLFLIGSVAVYFEVADSIEQKRRYGRPFWRTLLRAHH